MRTSVSRSPHASRPPSAQRGAAKWAVIALVAVAALVGSWFVFKPAAPTPEASFVTLQGEKFDLESLRGKVVLVNFWATSCVTCVQEMPMLVDTYNKYAPRGYETIAVAMSYDPPNYVLNFAETRQLPFKVTLDPMGEIARSFGDIRLTPTTFLLDKQGRVIKRYLGEPPQQEFHATIEAALNS